MNESFAKIIERLEKEIELLEHRQFWRDEKKCYDKAIAIVKEIAEEHNNGWILCSERLPSTDKNGKYLACGKRGGITIEEFVCRTLNNNKPIGPWWCDRVRKNPIAWQPLPEPYKEKRK